MNREDLQILRHAALELQESGGDLVRVAGIFQRIKNWWKARFSREFADRQEQIEEAYGEVKVPLQNLQEQLTDMDKAFKNQDPDAVAGLVHTIPETIAEVNSNMGNLASQLQAADAAIPREYVDERGNVLSGDDLHWVQKGYRQNYDLLQRLWEFLPEELKEIPIRQPVNAPVESFQWFSNFSPNQINISEKVQGFAKDRLRAELLRKWKDQNAMVVDHIIEQGFDSFLENLKVKLLSDATLLKVDWANVSKEVPHRPVNQMMYEIRPGWVAMPVQGIDLFIEVLFVKLNDLKSARRGSDQLSVYMIGTMKVEPDARKKYQQAIADQQSGVDLQETQSEEVEPIVSDLETEAEGPITSLVKQALRRKQLDALTANYGISVEDIT
jgi:hypothetical protein